MREQADDAFAGGDLHGPDGQAFLDAATGVLASWHAQGVAEAQRVGKQWLHERAVQRVSAAEASARALAGTEYEQ